MLFQHCGISRQSAVKRGSRLGALASSETTAPRTFKYKDIGAWYNDFNESKWLGYVGIWYRNFHEPNGAMSQKALRTFKWHDSSRLQLDQINVYTVPFVPTLPARENDGLYQVDYKYTGKVVSGSEEPLSLDRASVVAVGPSVRAWLSRFWLPAVAVRGEPSERVLAAARAAKEDEGKVVAPIRSDNWGMEVFIRDGDCRWSFAVVYDAATGAFVRPAFIQEYSTGINPLTPHVLDVASEAIRETRPQLPEDPASWLPNGSAGRRVARLWTAPGGQYMLHDDSMQETVHWVSPPASGTETGEILIRMPDSMYGRMPMSIAASATPAAADEVAGSGDFLSFEFGGMLRSSPGRAIASEGATLSRIVVRYDRITGSFVDISHEVFPVPSSSS